MKTKALLLALPLLTLPCFAHAAPHGITDMIHDYDLNHDGKVTRDEFDAERRVRFLTTDTDGNGVLSDAEYVGEFETRLNAELASDTDAAHRKEEYDREMKQAHVRFGVLDTDHDGRMTFDEYQVSGHAMFDRQDLDHDGTISHADSEILKAQEKQGKGDDFISP